MANMSYCRFENTSNDMLDCLRAITDMVEDVDAADVLNEYERIAAPQLLKYSAEMLLTVLTHAGYEVIVRQPGMGDMELDQVDYADLMSDLQEGVQYAMGQREEDAAL